MRRLQATQERGESDSDPAVPPSPEARWVLSQLSATLVGPVPCLSPQWASGAGGAGEIGSAEAAASRSTAHPG